MIRIAPDVFDHVQRNPQGPPEKDRNGMIMIIYFRARLAERSTWAAISAAVVGAATVAVPYSYALIAAGVIGALVPSPKGAE